MINLAETVQCISPGGCNVAIIGIDGHESNSYQTERYIFRNGTNQGTYIDGRYKADNLYPWDRAFVPLNTGFGYRYWDLGADPQSQIWQIHQGNGIITTPTPPNLRTKFNVGFDLKTYPSSLTEPLYREIMAASYYETTPPVRIVRRLILFVDGDGYLRIFSDPDRLFGDWVIDPIAEQTLDISPDPIIEVGEWCRLECLFEHLSNTTGQVTVYKDGAPAWQSQVVPIYNAPGFHFAGQANANLGNSGYARDNCVTTEEEFLGVVRVHATYPKFTVQGEWTKFGTGVTDNYQAVDEFGNTTNPNKADYVETEVPGSVDLYRFKNMPTSGTTLALQLNAWVGAMTTNTDGSVELIAKAPGGSIFSSGPMRVPKNYQGNLNFAGGYDSTWPYVNLFYVWERDPSTGDLWNVDALIDWAFGVRSGSGSKLRMVQISVERLFQYASGAFGIYRARLS